MLGRIQLAAPFDFELSFRLPCVPPLAAAHLPWTPAPDYWHGREYRRVVAWGGAPALLRLKSRGVVDQPEVEWRLENGASELDAARVAERVRRLLSADVDLAACYDRFRADAVLAGLSQRFHGLRVIRFPSLYECLVHAILEQQLNFHFAAQVKRRLAQAHGPAVEFSGQVYHGYPRPEALARLRPEDLRPVQISAVKARAILGVARAAAQGELEEARFAALELEAACERLMKLRGVGRWTAEYTLLRGLGHPDALPAADAGLRNTITQLYALRTAATPLAIRRRWRKLAPWRGYAAYYAWLTQWS